MKYVYRENFVGNDIIQSHRWVLLVFLIIIGEYNLDLLKGLSNKLWGFIKAWIIIVHIDCAQMEKQR